MPGPGTAEIGPSSHQQGRSEKSKTLLATNPRDEDIMEAIESVLRHDLDAPGIHYSTGIAIDRL
jgi:hypothetical protein